MSVAKAAEPVAELVSSAEKVEPAANAASQAAVQLEGPAHGAGFSSFRALKKALGSAGKNFEWHHVVEQRASNIARFGAQTIQNTGNIVRIDKQTHTLISAYYSSKQAFTGGLTVRNWLSTQSLAVQWQFDMETLMRYGVKF